MNTLTLLLFLALLFAVVGLAHQLVVVYVVAPRVAKRYGAADSRGQILIAKVEKIHRNKVLIWLVIIIAFCVADLIWTAMKVHFIPR